MKRILFVIPSLKNGGGVIRSLENFLTIIPSGKYSIDVLSLGYCPDDKVKLSNCRILDYDFLLNALTNSYSLTKGYRYRYFVYIFKLILKAASKLKCRRWITRTIFYNKTKKYSNYDIVIAFQEGDSSRFVSLFESVKKVAWIHCDYKVRRGNIGISEYDVYSRFDLINSVSEFTKSNFDAIYPQLKNKSSYIYNFLDVKFILNKSSEQITDLVVDDSKYVLISIGRISQVKQFSVIPDIIAELLKRNITCFKWILMGVLYDKEEMEKINSKIEKYNITKENFEYIGKRMNPYPYIRRSDLLISVSHSEACPFVVNEARVLGVPVISNNYPSIYEFIENGVNGYICPNESMPDLLSDLFSDKSKMETLQKSTSEHPYNNQQIQDKFLKVLEM